MKIGTTELLVILAIVLLIFGPSQLPKLSKMFGKSIKNFRDSVSESDDEVSHTSDSTEEK